MIVGNNIYIRPLESGDEKTLYQWRTDHTIMAYSELKYGFLLSEEAFRLSIQQDIQNTEMFPVSKTFMICKKENNTPIGDITYRHWDKRNRSAEFGMEIGVLDARGKGYGEDALYHFIDFMFRFLNLNKIKLETFPDNLSALKLYKKLGFKMIGLGREEIFDSRNDQYIDVLYMDLLKDEWIEIKKTFIFRG